MVIGFTDIANADVLWERNAAAMRDATLLHNQILRALLKKHSGTDLLLGEQQHLTACGLHLRWAQATRPCWRTLTARAPSA